MTSEEDEEECESKKIRRFLQIHKILPENVLHFGQPRIRKMCIDAAICLFPNRRSNIQKKAKTFSSCLNTGQHLTPQISNTQKLKIEPPKYSGKEIQIVSTAN